MSIKCPACGYHPIKAPTEVVEALREAVEFYDKRLAESKRGFTMQPSEFDPRQNPSYSEANRRERARAALAKLDKGA